MTTRIPSIASGPVRPHGERRNPSPFQGCESDSSTKTRAARGSRSRREAVCTSAQLGAGDTSLAHVPACGWSGGSEVSRAEESQEQRAVGSSGSHPGGLTVHPATGRESPCWLLWGLPQHPVAHLGAAPPPGTAPLFMVDFPHVAG